jgi:hypothetical protein
LPFRANAGAKRQARGNHESNGAMIRRRRRQRETVFGFDSFLDIVANVVGIIIRLILVAWVGAKSYKSFQTLLPKQPPIVAETAEVRTWEPPAVSPVLPFQDPDNQELARAQKELLEKLRQLQKAQAEEQQASQVLAALAPRKETLRVQLAALDQAGKNPTLAYATSVTLAELRQRQQKVAAEIEALQKSPAAKKALRYHAPVSEPVGAEEVFFECSNGRVTFIEIHTMLDEVKDRLREKGEQLRNSWQVSDVTRPVGPYRLRYTVGRHKGQFESAFAGAAPAQADGYSYGVIAWQLEPQTPFRGETAAEALAAGSTFRRIAAALESQATVATFWVYPDSFDLFRQLRDLLSERGITIAARPLTPGHPIAASIHGTRSRGQ